MKRSKYGMTVSTCVCCSITSDTQTRYGVGSCCQGRSWRPCGSNQGSRSAAIGVALSLMAALAVAFDADDCIAQARAGDSRLADTDLGIDVVLGELGDRGLERCFLLGAAVFWSGAR